MKKTLKARAEEHARSQIKAFSGLNDRHVPALAKAWLAGHKAAKPKPWRSPICRYCGQDNRGKNKHTHEFCDECGRIKEHCECAALAGLVQEGIVK